MNLKMSDLKNCVEAAKFKNVKTLLSSGNVVFDSASKSASSIEAQIEAALTKHLGRGFHTIVRSQEELQKLIASDSFAAFKLAPNAKRVVTFARKLAKPKQPLPTEKLGAQILAATDREAFTAYVPGMQGPVFMQLIASTFGENVTTRTWDTVKKCANA